MPSLKIKRGTRAQVTAAASANTLQVGELYHVTDEDRIDIGVGVGVSVALAKKTELAASDVVLDAGASTTVFGPGDLTIQCGGA